MVLFGVIPSDSKDKAELPIFTKVRWAAVTELVEIVATSVVFAPDIVRSAVTVVKAKVSKPVIVYSVIPPLDCSVSLSVPAPPVIVAMAEPSCS